MRKPKGILLLSFLLLSLFVFSPTGSRAQDSNAQDKVRDRISIYRANLSAGCSAELEKYCKDVSVARPTVGLSLRARAQPFG
jgi:hypothetical protein